MAERDAALAYWTAWGPIGVRFHARDREYVPEHWFVFGQRGSPLRTSANVAINPANAMLNYLYALLEAEATTALQTLGLDPMLGIVHADRRDRDSLALDVMEAVRPAVERYLHDLLQSSTFCAADFFETRKGACRILAPLTYTLADASLHFAQLVGPVVEHVAALLSDAPGTRIERSLTPLTNAGIRGANGGSVQVSAAPRLPKRCKHCGSPVPHKKRTLCDPCYEAFKAAQGVQRRCKACGRARAAPTPGVLRLVSRRRCSSPGSRSLTCARTPVLVSTTAIWQSCPQACATGGSRISLVNHRRGELDT